MMSNNLSFTDSVSFLIKDLGIESAACFMASHNASFEEYCFPSALTRCLTIRNLYCGLDYICFHVGFSPIDAQRLMFSL